jgi:membrane protease YdiL (CAAX protease family)
MTIKRLILIVLTLVAIAKVILSLGESVGEPQIQSRLELYQTNLVLQATELKPDQLEFSGAEKLAETRNKLLGDDPYQVAHKQYQEAIASSEDHVASLQTTISETFNPSVFDQLQRNIREEEDFIQKLRLKLGIIEAQQGETLEALKLWKKSNSEEIGAILTGLWSEPPFISEQATMLIENNLDGWFRYRVLDRLYQVKKLDGALGSLEAQEQETAAQALVKLVLIGGIPAFWGLLGIGILLFLGGQWLWKRERSLLSSEQGKPWETPWDGEIVWQVLIIGFFSVGQLLLPLLFAFLFGALNVNPTELTLRGKAYYVLASYLLMTGGGLFVLYWSIKSFLPLPQDWFRFQWWSNWIIWGVGGYCVAIPLVVVVSLINQQFWQGQGGSNPLLFLALQAQDRVVLGIFFLTAAIAAPIFEEIMFRGFLLPSLSRYISVWGAILISALIFAVAHLSVSEIAPLMTLGIVLGFVYSRSRNLLAPMLVHSLWNSGTLFSLFVLGS